MAKQQKAPRKRHSWSLRNKLLVILVLFSGMATLFSAVVSYYLATDRVKDISLRLATENTNAAGSAMAKKLESLHDLSNDLLHAEILAEIAKRPKGSLLNDGDTDRLETAVATQVIGTPQQDCTFEYGAIYAYSGMNGILYEFKTELQLVQTDCEQLYYDLRVPMEILEFSDPGSKAYADILHVLNAAINHMDCRIPGSNEFYDSIRSTREYLKNELYAKYAYNQDRTVICIGHTHIDGLVPVENSFMFATALHRVGVPCECHFFVHGEHGMSVCTKEVGSYSESVGAWVSLCRTWIEEQFGELIGC